MATRKKKNNIGAFGHPIYGKGFAKYGEMRPNGSSETPNDLEEAARQYFENPENSWDVRDVFIAGAKWQSQQHRPVSGKYAEMDFESARNTFSEDVYNHNRKNRTPIDMVDLDDAFETGADWMEEQMMEEAVDTTVHLRPGAFPFIEIDVGRFGLKVKDKVKVIIIKVDSHE